MALRCNLKMKSTRRQGEGRVFKEREENGSRKGEGSGALAPQLLLDH